MEENRLKVKDMQMEMQLKDDKMLRLSVKVNKQADQINKLESLAETRLGGLKSMVQSSLQEQFLAYGISDRESLAGMLEDDPAQVL